MKGIKSTDVPAHLRSMVDSLVWESSRTEEGYAPYAPCATFISKLTFSKGYRRMSRVSVEEWLESLAEPADGMSLTLKDRCVGNAC
jgi:hypothetical protein